MSMRGAEIERLRDLASDFREKAGELRGIISFLNSDAENSANYWKGPKADQFRNEWNEVKPTFDRFADSLDDAAKSADTNADNIEAAT
jgi:WXG100 family type VII secretion target